LGVAQTTTRQYEAPVTGKRLDTRRVYSALVFIPLFYLLVRYGPSFGFFALVTAVTLLAMVEFYRLHFHDEGASLTTWLGLACAGLLLASIQWPGVASERPVLVLTLIVALTSRLCSGTAFKQSLVDAAVVLFGVLYVGLLLGHLLLTRALPSGEWLIFFLVLVTWAGDTGAYYVGMGFGRRKLAPLISPNKTVEGLMGGLALSVVAALVARIWFLPSFSVADCVSLGLLLAVAGVLGDLVESSLKRSAGVKDSGALIPGHGGMLDRLDSMLFTAPTFYYYVTLVMGSAT
jgi:phosphatidate cytidylyltransferase